MPLPLRSPNVVDLMARIHLEIEDVRAEPMNNPTIVNACLIYAATVLCASCGIPKNIDLPGEMAQEALDAMIDRAKTARDQAN